MAPADPTSVLQVIQIYLADRCTGHGFPRCRPGHTMGSKLRRFFWFVIAVAFTVYGVWEIYLACVNYANFPTVTSITVERRESLKYPSVTICPLQPFRQDFFLGEVSDPYLQKLKAIPVIDFFLRGYFHDEEKLKICIPSEVLENVEPGWTYAYEDKYIRDCCPETTGAFIKILKEVLQFNITVELMTAACQPSAFMFDGNKPNAMHIRSILEALGLKFYFTLDSNTLVNMSVAREEFMIRLQYWTRENFLTSVATECRFSRCYQSEGRDKIPTEYVLRDNMPFSEFLTKLHLENSTTELEVYGLLIDILQTGIPPGYMDRGPFRDLTTGVWNEAYKDHVYNGVKLNKSFYTRSFYQQFKNPVAILPFDVVKECTFQSQDCLQSLYSTVDPKWKTCIHFNNEFLHLDNADDEDIFQPSGGHLVRRDPLMQTAQAGRNGGLMLQLSIPNSSILNVVNKVEGFAIAIGDSATMPRLDQFITVSGKGNVDLGIQRTEIRRLTPDEGGNCASEDYFRQAFTDLQLVGVYDENVCNRVVDFLTVLKICGCINNNDVLGGIIGIKEMLVNSDTCSTFPRHEQCVANATRISQNKSKMICLPACKEVRYDVLQTRTEESSEASKSLTKFKMFLGHFEKKEFDVTLNIYYRSLSTQVLTETAVYTFNSFIGNIGGLTGLYIGMSLVTVVELLELIFDLLFFRFFQRPEGSSDQLEISPLPGKSNPTFIGDSQETPGSSE